MKTKKIKKVLKKGFFVSLVLTVFFQPLVSNAANLFNLAGNTSPTTSDINRGILTPITPNDTNSEASGASNKTQNPQITVVFDRIPQNGQQVTATAMQSGFDVSGNRDLYYTWYIKHSGDKGDNGDDRKRWKREAARIMARGNFEANDIDPKGNIYNGKNTDGKGYAAFPKWGTGSADDQNCYMRSYSTGRLYEITSNGTKYNCPVGYSAKCVKSKGFAESQYQSITGDPLIPYPPYPNESSCTFPNPDYCEFDPNQDALVPRACTREPKYKVNNDIKNTCVAGPSGKVDPTCITVDSQNFATVAKCADADYEPLCIPNGTRIFNNSTVQADVCRDFGLNKKDGGCIPEKPILYNSQVEPPTYEPYPMLGSDGKTIPDELVKCVKYRGGNKCEHLFSHLQEKDWELGDGIYDMQDEQFWGTNPNVRSTAGNNQVDEANLIGLNMDKFTWTYQDGDQIGVAVEGATANPSKHDDSSYIITWAFSKNSCKKFDDYLDNIKQEDRQFYTEQNKTDSSASSSAFGILIAEDFDINDCLNENFIDPKSGGDEQLKVVLSYSPENPKNIQKDTLGQSLGSMVSVNASIENAQGSTLDNSFFWKIETSSDGSPNPSSWTNVTNQFTLNSETDGIGNNTFNFKLDADPKSVFKGTAKDKTYIRVSARVQESGGSQRSGFGKVVIGITNTNKNIEVYRTSIDRGKVGIISGNNGLICSDTDTYKPCLSPVKVVQNEIIGLKFSDEANVEQIVWTKNGEPLTCSNSITNDCLNNMHQVIPIIGVEGTIIEVTAKVKSKDGTSSQDYVRNFEVVKPGVRIVSANKNTAWEKIVGYEQGLDGNMMTLLSPEVLKTYFGNEVSLKVDFIPSFIGDPVDAPTYVKYQWVLNGKTMDNDNKQTLTFTPSPDEGPIYSVQINAAYSQPAEKRVALQQHWNVSAFDSQDAQMSASVQVEAQREEIPLEVSVARNFFASLISNISTQALFMIKVLLSGGLFFAATFVIFAIMPNAQYSEKRRI